MLNTTHTTNPATTTQQGNTGTLPTTTATPATGTATNRHTESVIIPLNVYQMDILDEIETIKVTLNNLAGVFSALHYANLSDWQIKSIAGNALYSATDLHYLAECLLDKASEYAVLATTLPTTTATSTARPRLPNSRQTKSPATTPATGTATDTTTGGKR